MGITCPVMMGMMFRDMRPTDAINPHDSPAERMATLQKKQRQIEVEIAELSRSIE